MLCLFSVICFWGLGFSGYGVKAVPAAALFCVEFALLFFGKFFVRDKIFHKYCLPGFILKKEKRPLTKVNDLGAVNGTFVAASFADRSFIKNKIPKTLCCRSSPQKIFWIFWGPHF